MKKSVLVGVVLSVIFMYGCSSSQNKTAVVQTPAPSQELSNVDPLLRQDGFLRYQLTDPALYAYLEERGKTTEGSASSLVDPQEQKKIGLIVPFRKVYKYNISGSVTIVSATKIKINLFTYNGACGPIKVSLMNQNNTTRPLAVVKEIASAVDQSEFNIDIPSNLSLIKFDGIGVYCPDVEEPVSVADLSNY
ncbi:MAG: hypothetical protein ABH810_02415 [bacterium]